MLTSFGSSADIRCKSLVKQPKYTKQQTSPLAVGFKEEEIGSEEEPTPSDGVVIEDDEITGEGDEI
jgi:hypothetical protein